MARVLTTFTSAKTSHRYRVIRIEVAKYAYEKMDGVDMLGVERWNSIPVDDEDITDVHSMLNGLCWELERAYNRINALTV